MGPLIARFFIFGIIIFLPILALIYGWRYLTKEDFKHTAKVVFAGILALLVVSALAFLETQ